MKQRRHRQCVHTWQGCETVSDCDKWRGEVNCCTDRSIMHKRGVRRKRRFGDLQICRFADLAAELRLGVGGSGPCVRGSPRVHSFRHSIPQKLKNEHSVAILCVAVMPTHDLDNLELH